MKKTFTLFLMLASLFSFSQSTTLVISQAYGAGGNMGALLDADYVELHNISAGTISLSGFSIQYSSATNMAAWSGKALLPLTASIPAGGYYLVQMSVTGANGTPLSTPDYVALPSIAMSASSGKVALVSDTFTLASCIETSIVDLLAYGAANCSENTPTGNLSTTLAAFRNNNGCDDTNNNLADFTLATPAPRNSASPAVTCGGTTVATVSSSTLAPFGDVCINTTAGPNSFTITGTNLTAEDFTVGPLTGYTFSTTSGGTYTSSLTLVHAAGNYTQEVFVQFTPTAVNSYNGNITVTGGGLTAAANVAVTGAGTSGTGTAVTGAATAITQNSATLPGTIPSAGCSAVTAYGFEYSLVSGFSTGTVAASTNLSGTAFTSDLSGLLPGTTYYYKAFVTNAGGTVYGVEMSFTTLAPPPPALSASSLTEFGSACVNSTSGPNSFDITGSNLTAANITIGPLAGFTFSTTSSGTYTPVLSVVQPGGAFTQTIYVKFTPSSVGNFSGNIPVSGGGATGSFSVAASGSGNNIIASINTGDATDIGFNSATAPGTVSGTGCSPVTSYGIEFSGINGFVNGSGMRIESSDINGVDFSSRLNGLVQGTTYYYKAYATNDAGISYGIQKSFTTLGIPDGLIIYNVPVIHGQSMHYSLKGIKPGHYSARIHNSIGQLVFQRDLILQVDFIDDHFILPGNLPIGLYNLEIRNHEYKIQKSFMVQ